MNAKRGFRCRILDIALWTDYEGRPACVVGAYGGVGDARVFVKTGASWAQVESVVVYPLECSSAKRVTIKASEG
jgi:hypothetical protein